MTKAEVQALIDSKLASGTEILASEHREVETALLNYMDNFLSALPLARGSITLTDIPSGGKIFDCNFPSDLGTNQYIVCGSLFTQGSTTTNGRCIFTITSKTGLGFKVYVDEIYAITQNSLFFDYVVFSK